MYCHEQCREGLDKPLGKIIVWIFTVGVEPCVTQMRTGDGSGVIIIHCTLRKEGLEHQELHETELCWIVRSVWKIPVWVFSCWPASQLSSLSASVNRPPLTPVLVTQLLWQHTASLEDTLTFADRYLSFQCPGKEHVCILSWMLGMETLIFFRSLTASRLLTIGLSLQCLCSGTY